MVINIGRDGVLADDSPTGASPRRREAGVLLSIVTALVVNVVADAAASLAGWASGGARGCDVNLGAGGRFSVLFAMAVTYGIVQLVLVTVALAISAWRGIRFGAVAAISWLGFAALSFALCCTPLSC